MNEQNFFYWLQGYFEISKTPTLDIEQIDVIIEHIGLVKNGSSTICENLAKIEMLCELIKEDVENIEMIKKNADKIKNLVEKYFVKVTGKSKTLKPVPVPHYCSNRSIC